MARARAEKKEEDLPRPASWGIVLPHVVVRDKKVRDAGAFMRSPRPACVPRSAKRSRMLPRDAPRSAHSIARMRNGERHALYASRSPLRTTSQHPHPSRASAC